MRIICTNFCEQIKYVGETLHVCAEECRRHSNSNSESKPDAENNLLRTNIKNKLN